MARFVISYDELPKSLNAGGTGSRRHWGIAHREKRKWEDIYGMLLLAEKVPRGMTSCYLEAVLDFRDNRRRDSENYRSAVSKPLADALVKGLWLPDDTDEFFRLGWLKLRSGLEHPNPAVKGRITIMLEPTYK